MTNTTSTNPTARHPKIFAYRPGADGVDDTFDIVHRPTNRVIAAFPYWDERAEAQRKARQFVKAMNALSRYAYLYSDNWSDVGELLEDQSRAFTIVTGEEP